MHILGLFKEMSNNDANSSLTTLLTLAAKITTIGIAASVVIYSCYRCFTKSNTKDIQKSNSEDIQKLQLKKEEKKKFTPTLSAQSTPKYLQSTVYRPATVLKILNDCIKNCHKLYVFPKDLLSLIVDYASPNISMYFLFLCLF
jgi:hypothetical protein